MRITALELQGTALIKPKRIVDGRGYFSEIFRSADFSERLSAGEFCQENEAYSESCGTVRGLHFQRAPAAQGKLVRVTRGAIFDVALDIRMGSLTFGQTVSVRLDAAEGAQLWVPPGFAHGYCTLEAGTVVAYKVTAAYSPADEGGVLWSDPALRISWPVDPDRAVVSERDTLLPTLRALPPAFLFSVGGDSR